MRVAVIGAGLSGIAAGYYLRRAGVERFTIFERSDGIGGTWWHNRYPGAAVDTWSHLYSFSFFPGDFTRTHVAQEELRDYISSAVDRFDLRSHIKLNTTVTDLVWDDINHEYSVHFLHGGVERYDHVISGVGMFSEAHVPQGVAFPDFGGEVYHSTQWPQEASLLGKRVAVVGTGSTAAQIVPAIAPDVAALFVFQRQANWVLPKEDWTYSDAERARYRSRWRYFLRRFYLYWASEHGLGNGRMYRPGTKQHARLDGSARTHLATSLAGREDLLESLTPSHPTTAKRPVVSSDWYPALMRENVRLVNAAVAKVSADSVIDIEGNEYLVDTIVLATGFSSNRFLTSLSVKGRDGSDLHGTWGDEPKTMLGVMVTGFPNFYMLYGPNTNATTVVGTVERQVKFAVWQIQHSVGRRNFAEARPKAQGLLYRFVQRGCDKTVFARADGYYVNDRRVVVTQWPYGVTAYGLLLLVVRRFGVCRRTS